MENDKAITIFTIICLQNDLVHLNNLINEYLNYFFVIGGTSICNSYVA